MNQFLGNEHFIFTPENPHGPMKFGSNPKIEDVTSFLNHNGENAEIVEGHYGKPERSILVRNPKNVAGLHQMSSDFGQESAIHSKDGKHEMHFYHGPRAGQVVNGSGTKFHKEKPADYYTTIHTTNGPIHFTHNFDFNKSEEPLTKMKAGPAAKDSIQRQPKQIKLLDTGPNKGRIVDVVNSQDTHNGEPAMAVQVPRGEPPLKQANSEGSHRDHASREVLKWQKNRPHKVVRESKEYKPGRPEGRIAEAKDTHKFLTHSPKQKELVHGVNLTQVTPSGDGWTSDFAVSGFSKNAKGQKVYVKGMMPHDAIDDENLGDEYKELSTPQREALYHNLAHMMGMGHYVPTTSVVQDPENGTNYSVMKVIPNAEHFNGSQKHTRILDDLKRSGEIDKLALMNTLLGNTDRHGANYMFSPKGLHMIDHGLAFDWHGRSGRDIYLPNYYEKAYTDSDEDEDPDARRAYFAKQPVHPEAIKWLLSIDSKQMKDYFRKHAKVPSHIEKPLLHALHDAQKMIKLNKGKVTMGKLRERILNAFKEFRQ